MADVTRQNDFIARGRELFKDMVSLMSEVRAYSDDYNALGGDEAFLQAGWKAAQGGTNVDAPDRPITKAEFIAAVGSVQAVLTTYDAGNDTNLCVARS